MRPWNRCSGAPRVATPVRTCPVLERWRRCEIPSWPRTEHRDDPKPPKPRIATTSPGWAPVCRNSRVRRGIGLGECGIDELIVGVRVARQPPSTVRGFGDQYPDVVAFRRVSRFASHKIGQLSDQFELLLALQG